MIRVAPVYRSLCVWLGRRNRECALPYLFLHMVNFMPKHDYVSILKHGTCWFMLLSKIATCKQPVVNCGKTFVQLSSPYVQNFHPSQGY